MQSTKVDVNHGNYNMANYFQTAALKSGNSAVRPAP